MVQAGAGDSDSVNDTADEIVGARIVDAAGAVGAEILRKARACSDVEAARLKPRAAVIGIFNPSMLQA